MLRLRFGIALALGFMAACAAPEPIEGKKSTSSHLTDKGRLVSETELAQVLSKVGFDAATIPKMICTAKYESSFYEGNTNRNSNGTTDYGIFQINSAHLGESGCPSSASDLLEVTPNAECALSVYQRQGLNAWVAYKNNKAECDAAEAPANVDLNASSESSSNGTGASTAANVDDGGTSQNPSGPTQDPWGDGQGDDPCTDPNAPGCGEDGWWWGW